MKTRFDCKHYCWLHCHNHVVVALFNKGTNPMCHCKAGTNASWCRFFEEGTPTVFSTPSNEWVIE